jgi:hypothetical protein
MLVPTGLLGSPILHCLQTEDIQAYGRINTITFKATIFDCSGLVRDSQKTDFLS